MQRQTLFFTVIFIVGFFASLFSQTGSWTWVHGSGVANSLGNYGVMGISSPTNEPPARYEAADWTDSKGNLWIYGGVSPAVLPFELNDLWKYDAATNEWTWMSGSSIPGQARAYGAVGVANVAYTPGERGWGVNTWVDGADNLWLFGGSDGSGRYLNDLWMFNTSTMMWTFYGGTGLNVGGNYGTKGITSALNWPGCRYESDASWVDALGNFWIFGGMGQDKNNLFGRLNDLWKYDPTINQWTWMSGDDIIDQAAVFGVKGVAAIANKPGSWANAFTAWKDPASGNFYLVGGYHISPADNGFMQDIWMYNPTTNMWTWANGSGLGSYVANGNFGTQCIPSTANSPAALGLMEARARWVDDCGNLWVYMGWDYNTLMRYNVATDEWTWVNGTNIHMNAATLAPVYGAKGIPAAANSPGQIIGSNALKVKGREELFIFGGGKFGFGPGVAPNFYSNTWHYTPDKPTASFNYSLQNNCVSSVATFTNASTPGCNEIKSYSWNFGDPASGMLNSSTLQNPTHTYNAPGNYSVKLVVINCTGSKDSATAIIAINMAVLTATLSAAPVDCNGQATGSVNTAQTGAGPYTYLWSNNSTTQNISNLPAGLYTLTITDINSCVVTKTVSVTQPNALAINPALVNPTCGSNNGSITTLVLGGIGPYSYLWNNNATTQNISNLSAAAYSLTVTDKNNCKANTNIALASTATPTLSVTNLQHVSCFGKNDASISINAVGGTAPYTYSWNNNSTNQSLTNISSGIYSVTVTDVNGCNTFINNIPINSPQALTSTITVTNACVGGNATANASASGGTGSYTYLWSNSSTTQQLSNLASGVYSITVTDQNNCTAVTSNTVNLFPLPFVNFSFDTATGCEQLCVNFNSNAPAAISYLWNLGNGTVLYTANASKCYLTGMYTVSLTVTDINGCSSTATSATSIVVHPKPISQFDVTPQKTNQLNATIHCMDLSIGATAWNWTFGDVANSSSILQHPTFTYSDTGVFCITQIVSNNYSCYDTTELCVIIDAEYCLHVPNTFTPNGDNVNETFYPKGTGVDTDNYQLMIFNRWGDLIWETRRWGLGWDGKINGNDVQIDTYVWKIILKDIFGERHTYTGNVNVIR